MEIFFKQRDIKEPAAQRVGNELFSCCFFPAWLFLKGDNLVNDWLVYCMDIAIALLLRYCSLVSFCRKTSLVVEKRHLNTAAIHQEGLA